MRVLFKLRIFCVLVTLLSILLTATFSYAEKRYIVDVLVVSLREGPAGSYRSIKSLKTGNSFTVLAEENKFIKVETEDGTIGWLPTQYTTTQPPKSIVADKLSREIEVVKNQKEKLSSQVEQLKERLAQKEQKITEVENKYSLVKKTENADLINLQKQLDTVTKRYETLVEESKSTIEISKERNQLKKDYGSLLKKVEKLEQENTSLANKQALFWFLAGGGVFILGWLIGRVSCKRQKSSLTL